MQDMQARIDWKNENGIKLNKKEKAFLVKKEKLEKEEELKRIEEEALKNQPKPVTTEDLLIEIRDLLKNK